jgi:hypothetical protein
MYYSFSPDSTAERFRQLLKLYPGFPVAAAAQSLPQFRRRIFIGGGEQSHEVRVDTSGSARWNIDEDTSKVLIEIVLGSQPALGNR